MSLLDTPGAQRLLEDATLLPSNLRECGRHLTSFLKRYLPCFYREEQREHAKVCVRGLLSSLERKTCLPVAIEREVDEKPLQYFVGLGLWEFGYLYAKFGERIAGSIRSHAVRIP